MATIQGTSNPANPPSSEKSYSREEIEKLVVETFPDEPEIALAVFRSESGLRADAVSPTGDYGIAQINLASHWDKVEGDTYKKKVENLKNPEYNIRLAKKIRDTSGFWPWVAFRTGVYKRFL